MRIAWGGLLAAAVWTSCQSPALAQEPAAPPATAPAADPAFEQSIERRAGETVDEMKLDDAAKAQRVKERFKQHFRDIQSWDVAHGKERVDFEKAVKKSPDDAAAKSRFDELNGQLQAMQKRFFDDVGPDLTPAQLDQVKERLVGGRYQHNIDGYKAEYPDMSPEAWQHVVAMWQQARDEAAPLGTAAEKNAVFEKWKGRVNNWISKQGIVGKSAAAKKAKAASLPAK